MDEKKFIFDPDALKKIVEQKGIKKKPVERFPDKPRKSERTEFVSQSVSQDVPRLKIALAEVKEGDFVRASFHKTDGNANRTSETYVLEGHVTGAHSFPYGKQVTTLSLGHQCLVQFTGAPGGNLHAVIEHKPS